MVELWLLVAIHFVLVLGICGSVGYVFHKTYVENKEAEALIRACEYRTTHLNAARLKEIINR